VAVPDNVADERWKSFLSSHYERLGLDIKAVTESRLRLSFNKQMCEVVEEAIRTECSKEFGGQNPGETPSYWNAEAKPSEQTGSR
jgi:hypothetical protein